MRSRIGTVLAAIALAGGACSQGAGGTAAVDEGVIEAVLDAPLPDTRPLVEIAGDAAPGDEDPGPVPDLAVADDPPGQPDAPGDPDLPDPGPEPSSFDVPEPSLDAGGSGDEVPVDLPDAGTPGGDVPLLKPFLAPCDLDGECASGLCLMHAGQRVCTTTCTDSCPKGWKCRAMVLPGAGRAQVCAPDQWALCRPCAVDDDCVPPWGGNGHCAVLSDLARACGTPCLGDSDCPEGYACRAISNAAGTNETLCVLPAGECPCHPTYATIGLASACVSRNGFGTCPGRRTCLASGLGPCDAPAPGPEVCNGKDDNCNGETDDGLVDCCVCGDGKCESLCQETLATCPADCKVCGDHVCSPTEGPGTCPEDCCGTCGDGVCMGFKCGENPANCPKDCGTACGNGTCEGGESALSCPEDCKTHVCGNGTCEPEDGGPLACPQDCGTACGNCLCDKDEDWQTCPTDCGFCGDRVCSSCPALQETAATCPADCCVPDCAGRECGPDGCGGMCGVGLCPDDDIPCTTDACVEGKCRHDLAADYCLVQQAPSPTCYSRGAPSLVNACFVCDPTRNATGWSLAPDQTPCGTNRACLAGTCGCRYQACETSCCGEGQSCFQGQCCTPRCDGKACGDDTCGGTCGECGPNRHCESFQCACDGVACGDGCCAAGESCVDGTCRCVAPGFACGSACCGPTDVCSDGTCLPALRVDGSLGSDGPGCGTTWGPAACRSIPYAISAASPGTSVLVARGTYTREDESDPALVTMKDGVSLYGGFCGSGASLADRKPALCPSVLDGAGASQPAYHVVVGASDARLDGFDVRGVSPAGPDPLDQVGGNLLAVGVHDLEVVDCTFSLRSDWSGSSVAARDSRVTFRRCSSTGGGTSVRGGSLALVGCAMGDGSSLWLEGGASVTLTAVTVTGSNSSVFIDQASQLSVLDSSYASVNGAGGQVFDVRGGSGLSLTRVTVKDCQGGILLAEGTLAMTGCTMDGDTMGVWDGGSSAPLSAAISDSVFSNLRDGPLFLRGDSISLERCRFVNNHMTSGADVVHLAAATGVQVSNCLFATNSVAFEFAAILHLGCIGPSRITNSTFAANDTSLGAGTLWISSNCRVSMLNSVLWGNAPGKDVAPSGDGKALLDVGWSDLEGYDAGTPCAWGSCQEVFSKSPLFANPSLGDFHVPAESPLVDAGAASMDSTWAPQWDLEGRPRPCGLGYDVGVYERCP